MNKIIVFLGPSLALAEAQALLPAALFLPPVRCGDILRVMRLQPAAIVIIDGFFENAAAVWHKEIVVALENNIAVYGASSMGALRAAELARFGMLGIGRIFEFYASGEITDDDEVAILHQDRQHHYTPLTIAMVNIRVTVEAALAQMIIDATASKIIIDSAKQLFYQQRTWPRIVEQAGKNGVSTIMLENFLHWCQQGGFVDQKKQDALAVLSVLRNKPLQHPSATARINLSHTSCLATLQRMVSAQPFMLYRHQLPVTEKVALAARLLGDYYLLTKRLARMLALVHSLAPTINHERNFEQLFDCDPQRYDPAWQIAHDCDDDYFRQFRLRLLSIGKITEFSISAEPLDQEIQLYIFSFMRLSNDYARYRQAGVTQESLLPQLNTHEPYKYRLLVYTAFLWRAVQRAAKTAELELVGTGLQQKIQQFRQQHGLDSEPALQQWQQRHDLTPDTFAQLVNMVFQFEYLVKNNNVDAIGGFTRNESIWWLRDALYVSDIYVTAKQLLTDPEFLAARLAQLNSQPLNHAAVYALDFYNLSDFQDFVQQLQANLSTAAATAPITAAE